MEKIKKMKNQMSAAERTIYLVSIKRNGNTVVQRVEQNTDRDGGSHRRGNTTHPTFRQEESPR